MHIGIRMPSRAIPAFGPDTTTTTTTIIIIIIS
jgi:hypothetical protein